MPPYFALRGPWAAAGREIIHNVIDLPILPELLRLFAKIGGRSPRRSRKPLTPMADEKRGEAPYFPVFSGNAGISEKADRLT